MRDFGVSVHTVGTTGRLVEVAGEVDVYTAPQLRRELLKLVDEGASCLVVDLTQATFVDSFLLGVLLGALKRMRTVRGRMLLVCAEQSSRRIFEITLLDRLFPIYETRDEALAAAGSADAGDDGKLSIEPAEHIM